MGRAKHRFKVGDVVEAQGARLKVLKLIEAPDGSPAYEMVSPYTQGEPWLVNEVFLQFARKVRQQKKKAG